MFSNFLIYFHLNGSLQDRKRFPILLISTCRLGYDTKLVY